MHKTAVLLYLADSVSQQEYEVFFSLDHTFADNLDTLRALLQQNGQPPLRQDCLVYEKDTMRHYDEHRVLAEMNLSDGARFVLF
ncbi:MAG: hypothetical protein IKG46_07445 [Solobacterium sp.]|nr:hypothetical protein [Solobacterium sp.]